VAGPLRARIERRSGGWSESACVCVRGRVVVGMVGDAAPRVCTRGGRVVAVVVSDAAPRVRRREGRVVVVVVGDAAPRVCARGVAVVV
jgi:hypothetical protein